MLAQMFVYKLDSGRIEADRGIHAQSQFDLLTSVSNLHGNPAMWQETSRLLRDNFVKVPPQFPSNSQIFVIVTYVRVPKCSSSAQITKFVLYLLVTR